MAKKKAVSKTSGRTQATKAEPEVCFVIMPFGGWQDTYYASIYSPAIKESGLSPHRADDLFGPSTIVNDIWSYTKKAKLLLADLTGRNANVFYELGLAHAIGKPAILVAGSMEDIPFDLRALRIILYDKSAPDWGALLKSKIMSSIAEVLESPLEAVLPAFLDVKETSRPTVSPGEKELIEMRQELDLIRRELRVRDEIGSETHSSLDIGPEEARRLIASLVEKGASDSLIEKRVMELGPPRFWVRRQISEARAELVSRKPARRNVITVRKPGERASVKVSRGKK